MQHVSYQFIENQLVDHLSEDGLFNAIDSSDIACMAVATTRKEDGKRVAVVEGSYGVCKVEYSWRSK